MSEQEKKPSIDLRWDSFKGILPLESVGPTTYLSDFTLVYENRVIILDWSTINKIVDKREEMYEEYQLSKELNSSSEIA
jgi:hypothetical protein